LVLIIKIDNIIFLTQNLNIIFIMFQISGYMNNKINTHTHKKKDINKKNNKKNKIKYYK